MPSRHVHTTKSGRGLGHVAPTISIDSIGVPVHRPATCAQIIIILIEIGLLMSAGKKIINKVNYCYECKKK